MLAHAGGSSETPTIAEANETEGDQAGGNPQRKQALICLSGLC
jgi:hypothetical protein